LEYPIIANQEFSVDMLNESDGLFDIHFGMESVLPGSVALSVAKENFIQIQQTNNLQRAPSHHGGEPSPPKGGCGCGG